MSFIYQNLTVSGSRADTEGASKFITVARTFLEAAGWQMIDDRTAQAGSATPSLTHKLVFSSLGETGNLPTYYMTIFSGTGAAVASSLVSFMMSTAYDTVAHDVPSSGVSTNVSNAQDVQTVLNTPSEANFEVWMSGDSQGVVFVTRQASTYDTICVGRANSFSSVAQNSFPLYINGASGNVITVTNTSTVRTIGGNPPQSFNATSEASIGFTSLASTNQPYDLDAATSIFLAVPLALRYSDANPVRKGVAGTLRNVWATVGTAAGAFAEGRLTASGTFGVQTYRVFPNAADALLIRET
jgi:hypothetical protein